MKIHSSRRIIMRLQILGVLACFLISNALGSERDCLRSIKESLEDPRHLLSTWDFSNTTEGATCNFNGVRCWNQREDRIISVTLRDMGLRGPFPTGIRQCTSLQKLDLSGNKLSGPIPSNLAQDLPYIVSLDLSNNELSGPIPPSFANFSFINGLWLDNNKLTGEIPSEFSEMMRLQDFTVANNRLSGPIPMFSNSNFSAESYTDNLGLCGYPLSRCKNEDDEKDMFLTGFAIGLPVSTISYTMFMLYSLPSLSMSMTKPYFLVLKKCKGMKHYLIPRIFRILFKEEKDTQEIKITSMEKYSCRMRFSELKNATYDFDKKKVIGYGNMGLMYKAFLNGVMIVVKRLHKFESFEKEFLLEIEILGRLKHTNLVPLLGFCFEMKKRFLVYKYMPNGTLHQWLHSRPIVDGKKMEWALRLRIAVGIARGLAWLHHNNVLRVVHLKINTNCILLDDMFEPKISNFGDAVILMNTNGTPSSASNYVVPHFSPGPFKEDVYSFGILLLELVSGKERPSVGIDSVEDDKCDWDYNVIDECLVGRGHNEEIYETLRIAENCIQTHKDGAASMLQVYQAIRAIGKPRNENSDSLSMDDEDNQSSL